MEFIIFSFKENLLKKVLDVAKATVFQNYDDAVGTISNHKGKCKSYRIYDVTDLASADFDEINQQKQQKKQQKKTIKKNVHTERAFNHLTRKIIVNAISAEKNFCIQK